MGNVSEKVTYIYGLIDPRTNELRYVGKTVLTPKRRLESHIRFSKNGKSHAQRWLQSLVRDGLSPEFFVIEEIKPFGDWTEAEQFWISYYRFIGCRLCNLTDGGEGHSGLIPSESTIEKIRNHHRSLENRDRVSRQSTEMWKAKRSEIILAQNAGKDSVWKEKQSITKKEQWKKPNNNLVAAMARRRKISDDDVLEIRKSLLQGATNASLALQYGVHGSLISHIRNGSKRTP